MIHNEIKREKFLIVDENVMPGPSKQNQLSIQSNNQNSIRYKNLSVYFGASFLDKK